MLPLHTSAKAIEHIGDRYLINVEELDLNGNESLMDVLMMCPDFLTYNGSTTYDDQSGRFAIHIDNLDINVDAGMFLRNTKAKDLKTIKMCVNPGIMKGCGGMKQVIDLNFRAAEDGCHGRARLSGDSYGAGGLFVMDRYHKGNVTVNTHLEGGLGRFDNQAAGRGHAGFANERAAIVWDITDKDNLEIVLAHNFGRTHMTGDAPSYGRFGSVEAAYTRTLNDDGAYAFVQVGGNYTGGNQGDSRFRETDPYAVFEFGFPFISKNIYITTGIETGYTGYTEPGDDGYGDGQYTERQRYEDGYIQADITLGKFKIMLGDRLRAVHFWNPLPSTDREYERTTHNNFYTASLYYDFNDQNTLQGTFARRFFQPGNGDIYDEDIFQPTVYVSEMRYTHQASKYVVMGMLKNVHQNAERYRDNILVAGVSGTWRASDIVRLTAGVDYNWQRFHSLRSDDVRCMNSVNLRLVPQVTLPQGWRFAATALYNSRRLVADGTGVKSVPNAYVDVTAEKQLGPWTLQATMHDIADTRTNNRGVLAGVTYNF